MNKKSSNIIIGLASLVAISIFVSWLVYDPVQDLSASIPGLDNRPALDKASVDQVKIGEKFKSYIEHSSELKGKWTQFRGADFDNVSKETVKLVDKIGPEPKIMWQHDLGEGHAAPVVYNGKVYILDYDEVKKADALRCFSLENGEEIWKRFYKVHVKGITECREQFLLSTISIL